MAAGALMHLAVVAASLTLRVRRQSAREAEMQEQAYVNFQTRPGNGLRSGSTMLASQLVGEQLKRSGTSRYRAVPRR